MRFKTIHFIIGYRKYIFFILLLLLQLSQIIFFKRATFFSTYDAIYWKDRYEHSQYQLPLSQRIIGDDGLYAYAGYRVINGDNPFSINVDKPPAAKYLIGSSIKIFGNPSSGSLVFGLFSMYIYFQLVYLLIKDRFWSLLASLLLFLDPIFFSQFFISGLDIYQLFFLLFNFMLVIKISTAKHTSVWFALAAGFALGFFIEIKPPILLPIVFALETILLLFRSDKKYYFIFIIGIIVGILVPYIRYIQLGYGFIDILKVHKYMLSFYQQSNLSIHIGAIIQTLLTGKFPHITSGIPLSVAEWSLMWPLISFLALLGIFAGFIVRKSDSYLWRIFALFLFLSFMVYTFIPSYPRYLLTILPFLYIFAVKLLKEHVNRRLANCILGVLVVFGFINAFSFLQQPADTVLNNYFYNFTNQYFQDIYQENLDNELKQQIRRNDFHILAKQTFESAGIRAVTFFEQNRRIPRFFGNNGEVTVRVRYTTQDLGAFYEDKKLLLFKDMNQWKVRWEWDLLINDFKPGYQVKKKIEIGERGSIIGKKGVIAQDEQSYLILVNPTMVDLKREEEMLRLIGYLGEQSWLNLQNAYLENVLPNTYVPLMTVFRPLDEELKQRLLSYHGVTLIPYPGRVYYYNAEPRDIKNIAFNECCTRIYSSTNYRGVSGVEKLYDDILFGQNGGEMVLVDSENKPIKIIIQKEVKKGINVYLN